MIKDGIRGSFLAFMIGIPVAVGALFGISIWANRPRGISIDLDQ
ncbi:MAG: hypothetical protein U0K37_00495 [Acutalibacteraceae bacterium]|nr:hypothetical protein [Acutalibacteraceae bacterium]